MKIKELGKTLKASELKIFEYYWCQLSNRVVLVISNIQKHHKTKEGDEFDYNTVDIQAWNPVTGYYNSLNAYDHQLAEIIKEE